LPVFLIPEAAGNRRPLFFAFVIPAKAGIH